MDGDNTGRRFRARIGQRERWSVYGVYMYDILRRAGGGPAWNKRLRVLPQASSSGSSAGIAKEGRSDRRRAPVVAQGDDGATSYHTQSGRLVRRPGFGGWARRLNRQGLLFPKLGGSVWLCAWRIIRACVAVASPAGGRHDVSSALGIGQARFCGGALLSAWRRDDALLPGYRARRLLIGSTLACPGSSLRDGRLRLARQPFSAIQGKCGKRATYQNTAKNTNREP